MLEAAKTGPVTLEVASCARPAPTPRQRPRPSGPSGKHPPHRGGGKSRLSYPEARSLELDGSRRGPFCRARALLQGVKRARCPCPGAGGRRRCRTHAGALLTAARRSTCRASLLLPAAARSVGPASRSPLDAPHPPPPIARCCCARSPSRASRRGCRGAGLPRGQSLPGILSGGARRPPARRAYPRATLHGCRVQEAEEVVAVAVEVARG